MPTYTNEDDPATIARKKRLGQNPYTYPAVSQMVNQRNTAFARNAPINTLQQNLSQIPIGGFGMGFGYNSRPMDIGNFLNQGGQQQPTMTGYHWWAGTGGVSGGNNDTLRQYMSDGTTRSFTGGIEDNKPLAPIQYTLPGVNADIRALSDPSVGALANAPRTTNQYGQQVVTGEQGGMMVSGRGPAYGSLQGSTRTTNAQGQQVVNTPSGGQIIASKPYIEPRKPADQGQLWTLGGWY